MLVPFVFALGVIAIAIGNHAFEPYGTSDWFVVFNVVDAHPDLENRIIRVLGFCLLLTSYVLFFVVYTDIRYEMNEPAEVGGDGDEVIIPLRTTPPFSITLPTTTPRRAAAANSTNNNKGKTTKQQRRSRSPQHQHG